MAPVSRMCYGKPHFWLVESKLEGYSGHHALWCPKNIPYHPFQIITCMELLFSNYLGDCSCSFQGSSELIWRCPSTVLCTVPSGWKSPLSVDIQLRTQLTKQPSRSSSKVNFFVQVRFAGNTSTVEEVVRVGICYYFVGEPTRETQAEQCSDTVLSWITRAFQFVFKLISGNYTYPAHFPDPRTLAIFYFEKCKENPPRKQGPPRGTPKILGKESAHKTENEKARQSKKARIAGSGFLISSKLASGCSNLGDNYLPGVMNFAAITHTLLSLFRN